MLTYYTVVTECIYVYLLYRRHIMYICIPIIPSSRNVYMYTYYTVVTEYIYVTYYTVVTLCIYATYYTVVTLCIHV